MPSLAKSLSDASIATLSTQVTTNTSDVATLQSYARGFRGQGNGAADATAADYTAVLDDAGKLVTMNRASAQTATVPPNSGVAFVALKDVLTWLQVGAGAFTLTPGAGVTITAPPGKTLVSNGVGAVVAAVKVGTNAWQAYGDLVPS